MIQFEITSTQEVQIDVVGLVGPDLPPVVLSEESLATFVGIHGVTPAEANFPSFISVTAVVTEEV